jgi:hypothetical protein
MTLERPCNRNSAPHTKACAYRCRRHQCKNPEFSRASVPRGLQVEHLGAYRGEVVVLCMWLLLAGLKHAGLHLGGL